MFGIKGIFKVLSFLLISIPAFLFRSEKCSYFWFTTKAFIFYFCSTAHRTQILEHARQILYHCATSPALKQICNTQSSTSLETTLVSLWFTPVFFLALLDCKAPGQKSAFLFSPYWDLGDLRRQRITICGQTLPTAETAAVMFRRQQNIKQRTLGLSRTTLRSHVHLCYLPDECLWSTYLVKVSFISFIVIYNNKMVNNTLLLVIKRDGKFKSSIDGKSSSCVTITHHSLLLLLLR